MQEEVKGSSSYTIEALKTAFNYRRDQFSLDYSQTPRDARVKRLVSPSVCRINGRSTLLHVLCRVPPR
eukprot:694574-Pyramimonas_sp.AAC.1